MAHTATTRTETFAPLHEESAAYARQCWGILDPDHEQQPVSWRAEQLASYWFAHPAHADVEAFLCWLPITIGGTPIDDPYPAWHTNTTDFELVTRLHLIRLYHNWDHETALCTYLDANPERLDALGVESRPNQSTLYTTWHDRFTEPYREDLIQAVEAVVEIARDHDVSVPERGFTTDEPTDDDPSRSARSQRRLATKTAKRSGRLPGHSSGRSSTSTGPTTQRSTTTPSWSYTPFSAVDKISVPRPARSISPWRQPESERQLVRITATASAR